MASFNAMVVMALTLVCLLVAGPRPVAVALSCGQVDGYLQPCIKYAQGNEGLTTSCCNGVRSLNNDAKSTADRQNACRCIKSVVSELGLNSDRVTGLPGKCGVSLPYTISPSMDCSKVQ